MRSVQQRRTIRRGRPIGIMNSSGCARSVKLQASVQEKVGNRFGRLWLISSRIKRFGKNGRSRVLVECADCGEQSWKRYSHLYNGVAGCLECSWKSGVPKWLYNRCSGAKSRCSNLRKSCYKNYGGRGIEFRFESPLAMALWIQEHLGLCREMQIDRIDNDGHYESGNLRWATRSQNILNTRRQKHAMS